MAAGGGVPVRRLDDGPRTYAWIDDRAQKVRYVAAAHLDEACDDILAFTASPARYYGYYC